MAIVKALPKTEDGRGVLCLVNGEKYQISHNTSKDKNAFTLWKIVSGGYEKVSSADMPQDLYPVIGLGCPADEEPEKKTRKRSVKKI